jgi:hypothetical protein
LGGDAGGGIEEGFEACAEGGRPTADQGGDGGDLELLGEDAEIAILSGWKRAAKRNGERCTDEIAVSGEGETTIAGYAGREGEFLDEGEDGGPLRHDFALGFQGKLLKGLFGIGAWHVLL